MTVRNGAISGGQVGDSWGQEKVLISCKEIVTLAPNGQKQKYVQKRMDPMKSQGQMLGRWPPC